MKNIEAFLNPFKLAGVKGARQDLGVRGMPVIPARA